MANGALRLPPGFRFRPTDQELVVHYLRRKAFSAPLPADVIPEINLAICDPWDLPGETEGERYFFYRRNAKCSKHRAGAIESHSGYWKAAGKDKLVVVPGSKEVVGVKKALVFHQGKPHRGIPTRWIMHEFCLATCNSRRMKYSLHRCSGEIKEWVVCRIFKKRAKKLMEAAGGSTLPNTASSSSSSCVTDNISPEEGDEGSSICIN
ncbi:hypothetical protein Cni_G26761 [Canna indica]|uniref:NAC domain-containing protein n=1 Tax=Canna indica TaxID=4628 RepID=A0AAQ3QQQ1_9LILI|nr:hypothetical protein Cni_G26761 [Canna indica]